MGKKPKRVIGEPVKRFVGGEPYINQWKDRRYSDVAFYRSGALWRTMATKRHLEYLAKEAELREKGLMETPEYKKILALVNLYDEKATASKRKRGYDRDMRGGKNQEELSKVISENRSTLPGQLLHLRTARPGTTKRYLQFVMRKTARGITRRKVKGYEEEVKEKANN